MEEIETKQVSKHHDKFIKISTIADGNCLIHAILKGCYDKYRQNPDENHRRDLARKIRKDLSEVILKPDERYPTMEAVSNLIRIEYKTETSRHFLDYLRIMYSYTSPFLEYPFEPANYDKKSYDTNSYLNYLEKYKEYIINFYEKIIHETTDKVAVPKTSEISKGTFIETAQVKESYNLCLKGFNELETLVDYKITLLRNQLHDKYGLYLYLPTNFNQGVIENLLKKQPIPRGKYEGYPYNCYLFTSCKASHLSKLEWEYHKIPEFTCLSDIPRHLNSNQFIGEADSLPYLPELMGVSLIILNFDESKVINIYSKTFTNKYVMIHNHCNTHFELVGLEQDGIIASIFDRDHSIIQECINSMTRENKMINFECLNPNKKPTSEMIVRMLKDELGPSAEIDYVDGQNHIAYVRYKQTPKSIYRFYVNKDGDVVSGTVTSRLKFVIKSFFQKFT